MIFLNVGLIPSIINPNSKVKNSNSTSWLKIIQSNKKWKAPQRNLRGALFKTISDVICFIQTMYIFFPLHGQEQFFSVITFLARRNYIILGRSAAPCKRDDVIHGEFSRRGQRPAIMASALGALALPPFGISKFSGFMLLSPYIIIIPVISEGRHKNS